MIEDHICTNVLPFAAIPKMSFICDDKIIKATALVKPEDTGPETKSMRKPSPKKPMRSSVNPDRKQSRQAFCQLPCAVWKVRSEAIAVGPYLENLLSEFCKLFYLLHSSPIGISLHDPRKIYTKQPRKDP